MAQPPEQIWSCRGADLLDEVRQVQPDEVLELLVGERDAVAAYLRPRVHLVRARRRVQRRI